MVVELVAVETVPEEKEGKFMHIVFLPDMHVQEDLAEVQTEKRWHYLPITQICLLIWHVRTHWLVVRQYTDLIITKKLIHKKFPLW